MCGACRSQFPLDRKVKAVWEPTVLATVVTPNDYVGSIMQLCTDRRGSQGFASFDYEEADYR